jgi:hypothetical protein
MVRLTSLLKELLTEVSVEQLKTQFVDSNKISQKDFDEIINTTSKTAYITWLAKKIADKIIKSEDIYKYKKYFSIFDRRKKEYPFVDINQYKTSKDLSQFISKSVEIANKESEDPSQQKGVSKSNKYSEFKIGSVDGYDVYKLPQGRDDLYRASCELGSGTEWCTATGKTRESFDEYISDGPLFIFIKPGSDEKYQFSYETDSFMDKNDTPVEYEKKIYPLLKFIESKEPEYRIPIRIKFMLNSKSVTNDDYTTSKDLNLQSLPITSLPDNLDIKGYVDISNTEIKSLPNNLKVGGRLNITDTDISSLPEDLKLEFSLSASGTNISSLPKNLKVIKGSLDLSNTPLTSLPDNLEVGKVLDIRNTPLTSLPDNLEVGGDLIVNNSKITSLPKDLKVEGRLFLLRTPISKKYTKEQLKQMLPGVKGEIYI